MSQLLTAESEKSQTKNKIIVALDVGTAVEAGKIVAELRDQVGAFKIGLQLFTAAGASFVREAVAADVKIFLDLKFHDIPKTVAKAAVEAAQLGVWMFNVHAVGGGEMMRKTILEVREFCQKENLVQPKIIGVTVLTSADRETLREVGIESEVADEVLKLARLTAKCGLDGVVASPQEVELIRGNVESKDFIIVTPGIRSSKFKVESSKFENEKSSIEFETYEDQKRVMTAGEAIRAGSDYLVIGRPILRARDKISAVREIIEQIETSRATS